VCHTGYVHHELLSGVANQLVCGLLMMLQKPQLSFPGCGIECAMHVQTSLAKRASGLSLPSLA